MAIADSGYDPALARASATGLFRRKRMIAFGVPAVILLYLVYVFFAFDIPGLAERARLDNARILLADTYSHKVHVTLDNRSGETSVAIEGENKGLYPPDAWPDWVKRDGQSVVIALEDGESVRFNPDGVRYAVPGYGLVTIHRTEDGITLDTPSGDVPGWINASSTRVSITRPAGRVSVTRNRTEALRYFNGWELFFFTLDSPFSGKSWGQLAELAVSGEQVRPGSSNVGAMASDFWNNAMWRHKDVVWAIFETVLMAFLGTMGAFLIAFPLAFLAATNFSPNILVRFGIRRLFDFLRGVDGLIWTIILSRAFGPGPLTGALAILTTDSGTFGKLFSEALENVDGKQIDGLRSTGANALQRNRFGVIPQVAPVILSQVLYYLESNTRSATVIGAIVGGGIGLLLTQAIQTQKDWEEVSYYIILTLLMVSAMDILSGWLRQRLIGRSTSPANS
ncbi:phosphonate ABC transporter, permease protein PhnE [Aquibium microcysteis]|uniref:phosphonate ABC transporter, permease protein PhnE n=1 Tax=Aquibium microcysteis TaxID=675281 RepID=UPI00165D2F14|nr:phosphonate ABC transporter, permease protein PhnE [Aquibium microcysteis]